MQTVIEIDRLKPLGTNILVKRMPVDDRARSIIIPESCRDRNEIRGQLFCGVAIAVGDRTRSARFGRERGWFDPGDIIWFWNMYDWKDHEMVLKDSVSGDEYLNIDESEVKAYEIRGDNGIA